MRSMSSPWPRSTVKVTTSRLYFSPIHGTMTEVSSPPLYAKMTLSRGIPRLAVRVLRAEKTGKNKEAASPAASCSPQEGAAPGDTHGGIYLIGRVLKHRKLCSACQC